jgi:hypothetical protein
MGTPRIDRLEKNQVYNANFDIWQRGTSVSRSTTGFNYQADRWAAQSSISAGTPTIVYSRQTDSPNNNSRFAAQMQATVGGTFATFGFFHVWETGDSRNLINKSFSIGFWYKSNKTGNHVCEFTAGIGGTSNTHTQAFTVSVADAWEYKTLTITTSGVVPRTDGENLGGCQIIIGLIRSSVGQGVLANNDYFRISQVTILDRQVTMDPTGASFLGLRSRSLEDELAACQRYYEQRSSVLLYFGLGVAANNIYHTDWFLVQKRATPSITFSSGTVSNITSVAIDGAELFRVVFRGICTAANTRTFIGGNNDASWTADSEL